MKNFTVASGPVALFLLLVVGLSGCDAGGPSSPPTPAATASAPAATPTVAVLLDIFSARRARPVKGMAALRHFGQENVTSAYREMVNLTFASRYNTRVMTLPPAATTPRDFRFLLPYMTPHAQQEWRILVAARLTDKKAAAAVAALRHYGWNAGGYRMRSRLRDVIHAPTFSAATAAVDQTAAPRLTLRFRSGATVRLIDAHGRHVAYTTSDALTLVLTPNTGATTAQVPWFLDGWHVSHKRGVFRPDPEG